MNSGRLLTGSESKIEIGQHYAMKNNIINCVLHSLKQPTGENILHKEKNVKIYQLASKGSKVCITKGAVIDDDAIIGVDSFVNKLVEPNIIVAGIPANYIKIYKRG
jgi:acetyltransferase-like isoleucine patch superfamily enzyme